MTHLFVLAFTLLLVSLYGLNVTSAVLKAVPAFAPKNKFNRTKKKRKSDPNLPNLYY